MSKFVFKYCIIVHLYQVTTRWKILPFRQSENIKYRGNSLYSANIIESKKAQGGDIFLAFSVLPIIIVDYFAQEMLPTSVFGDIKHDRYG